jgi:hypothetical protein
MIYCSKSSEPPSTVALKMPLLRAFPGRTAVVSEPGGGIRAAPGKNHRD